VETTVRNPNNIYILNDIGKEICFLGKENNVVFGTKEWVT
jgi:hypothetical protein